MKAGSLRWAEAWLLCSDAGTTASSSSDRLLGPKCWPHAAASWRDVAHVRDKTITGYSIWLKGWRLVQEAGKQDGDTKPT